MLLLLFPLSLLVGENEFFATMVVDDVMATGNDDRLNLIGIKKVKDFYLFKAFLIGFALELSYFLIHYVQTCVIFCLSGKSNSGH